ncbi:MAG: gliding motility protein GldN [Cytophagales bacterium]|nr:gliding motility protein GldN [Cytophagales bacterium]
MNKIVFSFLLCLTLLFSSSDYSYSQSAEKDGYNPLSIRQIHESYIMWNRTLWRRIDMKEKMNKPFLSNNREISKIIIDAVENGTLIAYNPDKENYDSATVPMTNDIFLEKVLQKAQTCPDLQVSAYIQGLIDSQVFDENTLEWGPIDERQQIRNALDDPFWGDSEETGPCIPIEADRIPARDFSIFRLRENLYFDRIHSRVYFDIQTVTMFLNVNSAFNTFGVDEPVATFQFIDLYNLFKSMPKEAIWFNQYNTAQHKNMGDAFLLRLFSGNIVKFSNFENQNLSTFYDVNAKEAMSKSYEYLQFLIEWESNLWEY